MLDFIYMGLAELWGTESKREIQNENMSLPGFEPATPLFPSWHLRPMSHADSCPAVVWTFTLSWHTNEINQQRERGNKIEHSIPVIIFRIQCRNLPILPNLIQRKLVPARTSLIKRLFPWLTDLLMSCSQPLSFINFSNHRQEIEPSPSVIYGVFRIPLITGIYPSRKFSVLYQLPCYINVKLIASNDVSHVYFHHISLQQTLIRKGTFLNATIIWQKKNLLIKCMSKLGMAMCDTLTHL